jgi:hypothetical protein
VLQAKAAYATEARKLQSLEAQEADEVEAVRVKYRPLKAAQSARVEEALGVLTRLQGELDAWRAGIAQKAIEAYTGEDVAYALAAMGVGYDRAVLEKNAVNGELLSMLTVESDVREALGVGALGDCTRVLGMVRSVVAGKGLPRVRDVTVAGMVEEISHWSIEQVVGRVCVGPLQDVAAVLRDHKIAGDVIEFMDIGIVVEHLGLPLVQRVALRKSILALRAKMMEPCTDACPFPV